MAAHREAILAALEAAMPPDGMPLPQAADRFAEVGIHSIAQLLGWRATFAEGVIAIAQTNALYTALRGDDEETADTVWPPSGDEGVLRALILTARVHFAQQLHRAPTATTATTTAAPTIASTALAAELEAERIATKGKELYARAAAVNSTQFEVRDQVKHKIVVELHKSYLNGTPVALSLDSYVPQLQHASTLSTKTYEFAGQTWHAADSTVSKVAINSYNELQLQLERRAVADAVAGAFDFKQWFVDNGFGTTPTGDALHPASRRTFVAGAATAAPTVETIDLFATLEVQGAWCKRLKEVSNANPHLGVNALQWLDIEARRSACDLLGKGWSLDRATHFVCAVSQADYNVSKLPVNLTTNTTSSASANTSAAAQPATGAHQPVKPTKDEATRLRNSNEQLKREVANLKRRAGAPNPQQRQPQFQPQFQQQFQPRFQPQQPFGGQPPPMGPQQRIPIAPDICKDFNFKSVGCSRGPNCPFKHICAICGANHPCKGNH